MTQQYQSLLSQIMTTTLDQDYEVAARRRRDRAVAHPSSRRLAAVGVVLVFGVMISVSAVRTERDKPAAAAERDELIAQIQARQRRLDAMHGELADLETNVASLQNAVTSARNLLRTTESKVTELAGIAGTAEVTGPGVEITANNAPGSGLQGDGVILDSDLQTLVNALWMAGAEAITINGHRLTTLTAIRYAGRAITVDYRSLTPPYIVQAIGDPDTLQARFLETPGGQAWLGLRSNFGIRFTMAGVQDLVLPADSGATLHEARAAAGR